MAVVVKAVKNVVDFAGDVLGGAADIVGDVVGGAVDLVEDVVGGAVDIVEDVVGAVGDAVEWAVDEVIEPVVEGVGDLIEAVVDDPITTIAKVAAVATGNTWAIPLIDGASTLAKGGDIDDALKSAAVSYVGGKVGDVVGTNINPTIAEVATNAGVSDAVTTVVQTAVAGGTEAAATAIIYGQNPLDAFLEGGLNSAVGATIGQISDKLDSKFGDDVETVTDKVTDTVTDAVSDIAAPITSGWENLQDGLKDIVVAGVTAELTGGEISAAQVGSIVGKYTGVTEFVSDFISENTGIDDAGVKVLTSAVTNAATTAIAGGSTADAFFGTLDAAGAAALTEVVDKPVNSFIDKVSGTSAAVEEAAAALREVETKATEATNGFNGLRADLNGRVQEQDRLKGVYNTALDAHNANPTQATFDALNSAATEFNTYADDLDSYYAEIKPQMDQYEADHSTYVSQLGGLQATYDENTQYLMSDMADLEEAMKPIYAETNRVVATTLRPGIDEDTYRRLNGLDASEDVYTHYLNNSSRAQVFDPADLNQANPDAYGEGYTYDPETNMYYVETPDGKQQVDPYAEYGAGATSYDAPTMESLRNRMPAVQVIDRITADMANILGESGPKGGVILPEHFKALKDAGYNLVPYKDGVTGKIIDGTVDYADVLQEFKEYTKRVEDEDTVMSGTVYDPEYGVLSQPVQYTGNTITFDGTTPVTQEIQDVLVDSGEYTVEEVQQYFPVGSMFDLQGGVPSPDLVDAFYSAEYAPPDYDTMMKIAAARVQGDGTEFDGWKNLASLPVSAVAEISSAVSGLSVIAGANPDNMVGRFAERAGKLAGDLKSDEWKAAAEDMRANSANYDAEWRAANPGQEPTTAQKAYLKTKAVFGNIYDHPVQWIAENVVTELIQEIPILLASGGTGNIAKKALLEAGEAHARKVASRVAIGTGVVLDGAEAFGGTAAGAFDEAYATYQKMYPDASEEDATTYALDVAQKAGSVALITMLATAGIGGQALNKSIFGDKGGSEFFTEAYDTLGRKIVEGGKVVVKEGATETVEEGLPAYYTGTVLSQIDPSYDVAGNVTEAAIMGKLAGAGTAAGLYTGNALVDAVIAVNPEVRKVLVDGKLNNVSVADTKEALSSLGFTTDTEVNALLNVAHDTDFTTEQEVADYIKLSNPEFAFTGDNATAAYDKFAGVKSDANLAAEVAAYIDPLFTTREEAAAAAAAEGVTLTDDQIDAIVGDGNVTEEDIAEVIDENTVNAEEVQEVLDGLGYEATEEEINDLVGTDVDLSEEAQIDIIKEYVDDRQVTEEEAREFFEEQGYEPTDEEVEARVGQGGEGFENQVATNVGEYVDPRQTTEEEARQFFADLDYIPSDEEVAARVGQVAETDVKEAIDAYVDPRYTTEEEIRQFFADQGFVPDDRIVERLVGQGGKNAEQMKEMLVAGYVDPRQVTEAEARQFFANQGYEPTDEEVAARVGQSLEETFEADTEAGVEPYVNPRQVTEAEARKYFEDQGYTPTDEEVAARVGQGEGTFETDTKTDVDLYVDPRQVTDEEARQFFADLGYNDPTDEQVAQFVAQVEETTQQDAISKYVDPRQVTQAEVQAIADEEGLTLTEALAATYIGQSEAENFQTEQLATARAEYDPLATTLEEATQFFADTGYTADTDEIAQFVASKTEEVQTSAIGAYVDPRQMTSDEAREFLSAIGYNPTDQEVADFTGQLNDENYQVTQKTAIDEYVDPRFFDAGEVRAAYEELGLVDVTQEDVDRFVGQIGSDYEGDAEGFENARMDELRTYMPTATFNVIKSIMGSPAVADDPNTEADESKDATGIYAELEAGATRDEALQAAVDKLATDLGTTKDDLLDEIGLSEDRLREEIGAVIDDVTGVKEDVAGVKEDVAGVTEDVGDLADILGTAGVEDDPDTEANESQDPTGLFATIKAYEDAGLDRDQALQKAIDDVAGALGTTKDDLLDAIGETETSLSGKIDTATDALTETIGDVETRLTKLIKDNEDAGLARDEATQKAVSDLATELGTTKTDLLTAIGNTETDILNELGLTETRLSGDISDVETSLGADIDAVADLIGKPARDVTQTDIDFVIDLIAQENVSAELTAQYDVNADGIVDIADQTLLETALQGDQDVTLADTSMFTPATGLYLQQEQDTQATQDLMTELNTQLNTQINTQDQQQKLRDLVQMEELGAFKGAKTTVSSADPMNIDYLYDFSSVFANPSQEGLFASPYSTTTRNKAANQPMGPMSSASGFAEGGQVEDENDMLLRILGEM